jgi:hypothetical protein
LFNLLNLIAPLLNSITRLPDLPIIRSSSDYSITRFCQAAVLALLVSACGDRAPGAPSALDAAAESYVRLVLALGERDADSLDTYHGPPAWQFEARARHATLADIRTAATSLADSLTSLTAANAEDEVRRQFLIRQLRASATRIDIVRGARPPFAEEARALFALGQVGQVGQAGRESTAARAELERLMPGRGDLAARYAAFDRRFLIPRDRLRAVLSRAIEGCRAATGEHVSLPPGERVEVEYVADLAWSAFTRYQGRFTSRIRVNTALPLTVDRALDLACHEAYPGHHAIDSLLEARFGSGRVELLVRPLFSPQSLLHEAASSGAADLAFPESARVAFERDELFPLAGLDPSGADGYVRVGRLVDRLHGVQADIARRYLDGQLDFSRASTALELDALMPSADATLKFLNQFRSYAATYTAGRDAFSRYLDAHSTDRGSEHRRLAGAQARTRQASGADEGRWRAYINVVTNAAQIVPPESDEKVR